MKNFNEVYEKVYKNNSYTIKKWNCLKAINIIFYIILGIIIFIFFGAKLIKIPNYIKSYNNWAIGIWAVFALILFKITIKYSNTFNETIINDLLKEYDDGLNYDLKNGISYATFRIGELEKGDKDYKFYSKNYIYGVLNNKNKIISAYVNTYYHRYEAGYGEYSYRTRKNMFNGIYINIELSKYLDNSIKLRRNLINIFNEDNKKAKKYINSIKEDQCIIEEKKIDIKHEDFSKKFVLLSSDEVVALKIFDNEIIQKLLNLKERIECTPELTIKGNHLIIGISPIKICKDPFVNGLLQDSKFLKDYYYAMKNPLDYELLKEHYYRMIGTIEFALDIDKKISEIL